MHSPEPRLPFTAFLFYLLPRSKESMDQEFRLCAARAGQVSRALAIRVAVSSLKLSPESLRLGSALFCSVNPTMADDPIASFLWASPQQQQRPSGIEGNNSSRAREHNNSRQRLSDSDAVTPRVMQRVPRSGSSGGGTSGGRVETVETALTAEVVSNLVGGRTSQLKVLEEERQRERAQTAEVQSTLLLVVYTTC